MRGTRTECRAETAPGAPSNGYRWDFPRIHAAACAQGTDFQNWTFYQKTVIIDEADHTFPTNMKIRFMCDASGNRDDVFIDEVRVSAQ